MKSVVYSSKNSFRVSGESVHQPATLANVHTFTNIQSNPSSRAGGVLTGRDAFERILCGASMVQVGTTEEEW